MCVKHVAYRSQIRHGMGYKWIVLVVRWVINGSLYEPQLSHMLVTLSNTTFFIFFSKLTNLWPCHNLTILRTWKMHLIFNQLEESNPVVSLTTLLWRITSWLFCTSGRLDNSFCLAFIFWVGRRKSEYTNVEKGHKIHLCGSTPNLLHAPDIKWVRRNCWRTLIR